MYLKSQSEKVLSRLKIYIKTGFMKFYFKQTLKVLAFYLDKQKRFYPKDTF